MDKLVAAMLTLAVVRTSNPTKQHLINLYSNKYKVQNEEGSHKKIFKILKISIFVTCGEENECRTVSSMKKVPLRKLLHIICSQAGLSIFWAPGNNCTYTVVDSIF
jgi:hypothetical protein